MSDDEELEFDDVMDFPVDPRDDDRRWLVLYPEDYDNFARDPQGNLGFLVDQRQAGEVLELAAEVVATLSHLDADGDDVLEDLIAALEKERGDDA